MSDFVSGDTLTQYTESNSSQQSQKGHARELVLDVTSQKQSLLKLKDSPPSKWNDTGARHVYSGFKVTRYIVENNYIFNPNLDQNIPLGELLGGPNSEWWSIKKKLEEVLEMVSVPGIEKMANGLHNYHDFMTAWGAFSKPSKDASPKHSTDATVKAAQKDMETDIFEFMRLVEATYMVRTEEERKGERKLTKVLKLDEAVFETYLETLFRILGMFTSDDEKLSLNKSTYANLQFTTSSLGTLVYPEPDFYVKNPLKQHAAVVEVKPHYGQLFPFYRSRRFQVKKMKTSQASLTTQDEEEDMDMDADSSIETMSEEEVTQDKLMDDSFEYLECKKEEKKDEKLGEHIRHLRLEEKKQVRCFLPQLIADMMGASNTKGTRLPIFHCLQYNTAGTKRFGIGLVGVKARFVTMIIRDKNGKTPAGPSDIEDKSVSTKVYMTQELNLFKKTHLMMFFEILYAMGKLTYV